MSPEARLITDEAVYREVSNRFAADPQFRADLWADAGKTLGSLGIQIPKDVLVRVEREPPATERLVVYSEETRELSDEDLEKVAGGLGIPRLQVPRRIHFADEIAYGTVW